MLNSPKHNRRSIRLKDYDYSNGGAYFITICAYRKQCIFGEIIDSEMELNEVGKMVKMELLDTQKRFNVMELDHYTIMPNHIHCIVFIVGATLEVARMRAGSSPAPTIGNIVGAFKSITTNNYFKYINKQKLLSPPKLWQRNYYERVIRNENELYDIRQYIQNNPIQWNIDEYYSK
ncbi:MAG: transposase [Candidatus Zixiibacteriota bacterium]